VVSLGSFLKRQPTSVLGLDISSSSVKLVELSRKKTGDWLLERFAREPLEPGCFVDGAVEKPDEIAKSIRRMVKKSGTRVKRVAIALPDASVITKKILLPSGLSALDLEQQVEAEAVQYIPFSLDEVYLDYCEIGPSEYSEGNIEVLIAASRREKVNSIQSLMGAAGLAPHVLDIESYAARLAANRLVMQLPNQGVGKIVALFQIGSTTTSMHIVRDQEILYEREQSMGGAQLTDMIVAQYGFSFAEAEVNKCNNNLPQDYETAVLKPYLKEITNELARFVQFFFSGTHCNHVDHIFLAGGGAGVLGLAKALTRQTSFPCKLLNPFDGMESGKNGPSKKIRFNAPSYLTACGLAMRGAMA
jgi:type IV pilus assembly protein PilM